MAFLDQKKIRAKFPALQQEINHQPVVFFDGPGGTQVPNLVIEEMSNYLRESNANAHGAFATSIRTDQLVHSARLAMSDFLGCDRNELVFGANMTTLTFALSRAIARELKPGDEIIVTKLDHYANVSPWVALEAEGVIIRTIDLNLEDCTLDLADLKRQINQQTKLVAVGYAANAVGTINNVAEVVKIAHSVNALVFIDAVHYAPHGLIDVKALDCDFLVCSGYKFFGPHVGILYGKQEHLNRLRPYRVKPAPIGIPDCWETGTLNFEGLAGLVATINYLADLGYEISPSAENRRTAIVKAMTAIQEYEQELCKYLITGLLEIPGLTFYGIRDPKHFAWRTPTVGIRMKGQSPYAVAKALGDRGIFTWHGNFYALGLTERLGIESSGGLLRIGLVHYNTLDEIDRLLTALTEITALSVA
ncbi:MAG: cysteine desulfurase-like protein [Xenococcaceae cyanobacterium MO_188.B19]|nr:cysteine desulfurase-like protein [Xenococcaceae cyanobacterium MO_188.B19]